MALEAPARRFLLTLGLFAAILFLWPTRAVYPFKVLVVMLHEIGHGAAAVATGGSIVSIELSPDLGGLCRTRGGFRPLILSAGYLGSMLFGGLIMLSAATTRLDRQVAMALGLGLFAVTLFYVRSVFGFATGAGFGVLLFAAGLRLPMQFNDTLLSFIGLTSMLYAIIDIKEDLLVRTVPQSDAYQLSLILPLPSVVWGAIWAAAALLFLGLVLHAAHRRAA